MIRIPLPEGHNDTTEVFRRQSHALCNAQEAQALHPWHAPLALRLFYVLLQWGWLAVPITLAVLVLTGCQLNDDAISRAVFADAQAAPGEVAQAQRIERITAMVEASQ